MATWINGIRCDPKHAKHITTDPGHSGYDRRNELRRFDEVLYRNREGYFFVVRPLGPDEAYDWMVRQGDGVLVKRIFPDVD